MFGAVEVDIEVKSEFSDEFQEYPPFFCTCDVPMSAIGEHMLNYCHANEINFDSKKLLISGCKAKKNFTGYPAFEMVFRSQLPNHKNLSSD